MEQFITEIDGRHITVRDPDKLFWPEAGITKLTYLKYLQDVSHCIIPYTKNRMLMIWRYPDGVGGKKVEQRSVHGIAPDWIPTIGYKGKQRMLLNDTATLIWIASHYEALEFHVPFDRYDEKDYPTELLFDLDPTDINQFDLVRETALQLKSVLDSLGLFSVPKTSGKTGLQVFIPIASRYTFEETRKINTFIAQYIAQKMPDKITLDRVVERRGTKLYFDYLQLWRGRTAAAPYSARATSYATVSAPLTWNEVQTPIHPTQFTIANMIERIREKGDLFSPVSTNREQHQQSVDEIVAFIKSNAR